MYFIINLSGSQQFSGSSIQNQVELSEWATGRFMHCNNQLHLQKAPSDRPMSMSLRCFVRAIGCVASLVISTEVCLHSRSRRDVMRLSNKRSPYLFGVATANRTKVTTLNKYGVEIIARMSDWENGHATTSRVQQPILTILSNFAIVAKLGNPRCL